MDPSTYFPYLIVILALMGVALWWLFFELFEEITKGLAKRRGRKNPFPIFVFPLYMIWELVWGDQEEEKPARHT